MSLASLEFSVRVCRRRGEGSVLCARGGFALLKSWGIGTPPSFLVVPPSPSSSFSPSCSFPSPASFFSLPISILLASSISCLRPVPSGKELLPLLVEDCSSFRFFLGFGLAPKEEKPIVCARESVEPEGDGVKADIVSVNVVEMVFKVFGMNDGANSLIRRYWYTMKLRGESGVVVCAEDDGLTRVSYNQGEKLQKPTGKSRE